MTTLPAWIDVDGGLGDLAAILPELETYRELATHWRAVAEALWKLQTGAPVDSPVRLAFYVASNIDNAAVVSVFDELGLTSLHQQIKLAATRLTDPEAPWAKLIKPCNAFNEQYGSGVASIGLDDGNNPGLVALHIPSLVTDATQVAGDGNLAFNLTAAGGFECEAGAVWPFKRDKVEAGLLRLGANGNVSGQVGFSLPFGQLGSGKAHIAASAAAALSYFYRPAKPEISFAEALIPTLTGIPAPLDLSDLHHAMQLVGLEGVVLNCEGAASSGLSAMIGKSVAIPDIASLQAGFSMELNFRRNAHWLLSLRRTGDGLRFVLSRDLARERDWAAGVDLTLDYAPLARRVHDLLSEADGLLQPALTQIRPFLSPGTYIATEAASLLKTTVASITQNEELRAALETDLGMLAGLGTAGALELPDYLSRQISDLAATQSNGILSDVQIWADTIATGLSNRFPALANSGLQDAVVQRIKPLLKDAQSAFDNVVKSLVVQPAAAQQLAEELRGVGIEIAGAEQQADAVAAGARDLVKRIDAFSREVLEKTGEGVSRKLQARFGWSGGDKSASHYEIMGSFTEINAETCALWRSLVLGRLEPFQRILSDPMATPAGLRLDPLSSLARFAGTKRGFSLEIVVFDLTVSIRSIVEGKAKIGQTAGGDLTVWAEGTAARDVDGFDEGRGATFVSTWDLALMKSDSSGQRAMTVALAFDHDDKNLKPSDVSGFLSGLADHGLVEASRVTRALEVYQQWRIATPSGKKVSGRIDVRMTLPSSAVSRMVALGRTSAIEGNGEHRALFAQAAAALLAAGVSTEEQFARDCREARREFEQLEEVEDPWRLFYGLRTVDLTPPQSSVQRAYRYSAFEQLLPLALSFPRLLAIMARIYDAIPVGAILQGHQWTEEEYAHAEKDLAAEVRRWLRLNQKFLFWFRAEIHPVMLAFLRLLADMNRAPFVDGEHGDALPTMETSKQFVISMSRPEAETVTL